VLLACATKRSLRWLAQSVGVDLAGLRGELKLRGLVTIWLWTLRAWERDDTADLSATMAALDAALNRAEQAARWLRGSRAPPPPGQQASQPEAEPPPSSESSPDPFPEPPQQNPLP
jgi:hypothetical protein